MDSGVCRGENGGVLRGSFEAGGYLMYIASEAGENVYYTVAAEDVGEDYIVVWWRGSRRSGRELDAGHGLLEELGTACERQKGEYDGVWETQDRLHGLWCWKIVKSLGWELVEWRDESDVIRLRGIVHETSEQG